MVRGLTRPIDPDVAGSGAVLPAPRLSRLWWFTAPALLVLVGGLVVLATMRLPYVMLSPGGARSVQPLVEVSQKPGGPAVHVDPASDDLLYLTVSTSVNPSGILVLRGLLDDSVEVDPSKPFLGTQTSDENRRLNLALMTDSQDKARKVALEKLGYTVTSTEHGAFIEDVDPSYPAASVLKPGMTVVGADGKKVGSSEDLAAAIKAHRPGDKISLEVVRLGEDDTETVLAELGARPDDPKAPLLGVILHDRVSYDFPVRIDIDTGEVGGPSAGLAFTLAILDRMTPGSLTGDHRVAVTGTIELDGSVGPVGGVQFKTQAAIEQGAKLMLVPPDELQEARTAAHGRLQVKAVRSLDEALAALEAFGGDPLPKASK